MLTKEENDLLTRTGPGTSCGELVRCYWQPAALSEELPRDPRGAPLPVRLLGEDLALFRDEAGRPGLLGLHCPHRGADLSYGRLEDGGLRCIYHGWLFDVHGSCLEQPGEPAGSMFHQRIQHVAYPCQERNGVIFAYLGTGDPPLLPNYAFLEVPEDHVYAVKLYSECNYLQANEANLDFLHTSFLHYSERDIHQSQFSATDGDGANGGPPPLSRRGSAPYRERIEGSLTEVGLHVCKIRQVGPNLDREYIRVGTFMYPNLMAVPGGQTNWHVPIDDTHHWKYTIIFDSEGPIDRERVSRAHTIDPHYRPIANRENRYLQDRALMRSVAYSGIHPRYFQQQDLCANESAGPIQDRTQENLVASDVTVVIGRKLLAAAIKDVQEGRDPPGVFRDPARNDFSSVVTTSGDLPSGVGWKEYCQQLVAERRGWTPVAARAT